MLQHPHRLQHSNTLNFTELSFWYAGAACLQLGEALFHPLGFKSGRIKFEDVICGPFFVKTKTSLVEDDHQASLAG